jgi:hypothetical protein
MGLPDSITDSGPVDRNFRELDGRFKPEPWHEVGATGEPAFENSWVSYNSATYQTAAFYKDAFGVVHLKGLIKNGTIGAAAFTLPAGYRPPLTLNGVTTSNGAFGDWDIDTAGVVRPANGSNIWFSLNNISFRAA